MITVYRRSGFHRATMRSIAQESGVTQSNIYNYVRTKGDIRYLVCEHLVGLYVEGVEVVTLTPEQIAVQGRSRPVNPAEPEPLTRPDPYTIHLQDSERPLRQWKPSPYSRADRRGANPLGLPLM
ncbi:TetR/AcrR family transcriptional regulator [Mesorhizobium sp. 1B3]|uniref:TetR/AcrR family transcriptional regulator n=1 Tax=Mesorhizobium sp. 1B3 TaxID=3243599 RepID=UPI003D986806